MSEELVLRSLQQGVTAAVAASTAPDLPVSYVMSGFPNGADTPDDQKWLEIVHIPNNMQGDFWGDEKNYRGIMRLVLHWPNKRGTPYGPLGIIGSIADYFYKGRMLGPVQIYELPDLTGVIEDKDDILFPVSIRYSSFIAPAPRP